MWFVESVILFILFLVIIEIVFSENKGRHNLPSEQTFDFEGAKINFRIIGKGSPVVLLHGSMVYDPWGGFEKLLAKKHTVYWLDLPGFGASEAVKDMVHDTDLFSKCVSEFITIQDLVKVPIISFSLGTIVAAKVVAEGNSKGMQIMIGAPGKLFGSMSRLACESPIFIRRVIASTNLGKREFLIPMLRGNTGDKKGDVEKLLRNLSLTDPKALADIDYQKEMEIEMPLTLSKIDKSKVTFIYGELDNQKGTNPKVEKFIEIKGAGHGPFGSHGKELLSIVEKILN